MSHHNLSRRHEYLKKQKIQNELFLRSQTLKQKFMRILTTKYSMHYVSVGKK